MIEGHAIRRPRALLRLRVGDHRFQLLGKSRLAMVQSAVALLRTVFEDHFVDPEHNSCLFFQGCMLIGSQAHTHDFTVTHGGDRVILSDFTFPHDGPAVVSLSLTAYATEVLRFSMQAAGTRLPDQTLPDWQERYLDTQLGYLRQLLIWTDRLVAGGCETYSSLCEEFHALHGEQKRPLEMQVLTVQEGLAPRQPFQVLARIAFGPLRTGERLPMRLNRGDVVLVTVNEFTNAGVLLTLEGVGSGGVRPGDALYGLQFYYP